MEEYTYHKKKEMCNLILRESHRAVYMVHPRIKKMNLDFKTIIFLEGNEKRHGGYLTKPVTSRCAKI